MKNIKYFFFSLVVAFIVTFFSSDNITYAQDFTVSDTSSTLIYQYYSTRYGLGCPMFLLGDVPSDFNANFLDTHNRSGEFFTLVGADTPSVLDFSAFYFDVNACWDSLRDFMSNNNWTYFDAIGDSNFYFKQDKYFSYPYFNVSGSTKYTVYIAHSTNKVNGKYAIVTVFARANNLDSTKLTFFNFDFADFDSIESLLTYYTNKYPSAYFDTLQIDSLSNSYPELITYYPELSNCIRIGFNHLQPFKDTVILDSEDLNYNKENYGFNSMYDYIEVVFKRYGFQVPDFNVVSGLNVSDLSNFDFGSIPDYAKTVLEYIISSTFVKYWFVWLIPICVVIGRFIWGK